MKQKKSVEDYLKVIYVIFKQKEVHGADIAEALLIILLVVDFLFPCETADWIYDFSDCYGTDRVSLHCIYHDSGWICSA